MDSPPELELMEDDNGNILTMSLDFQRMDEITPVLLESFQNISILSLNSNLFTTFPTELYELINLENLSLRENHIDSVPPGIINMRRLKKFDISGNFVETIADDFCLLENLQIFKAHENNMKSLPHDLGNLKNLIYIGASYNELEYLPQTFGNLCNLKRLDLSDNHLQALPWSFKDLPSLEVMDFTNNKLDTLPEKFLSAEKLTHISLSRNNLVKIPAWFSDFVDLIELDLSTNTLCGDVFPEDFGAKCKALKFLNLSGNEIKSLPESVGKMCSLEELDVGSDLEEMESRPKYGNGNSLITLPSTFPNLLNLTKLELDENLLQDLPYNFGDLKKLIYLDLSHNNLKHLPESFCKLVELRQCLLSCNCLTRLPDAFGKLMLLKDLRLSDNMLTVLPESFENLISLEYLDLYGNKLTKRPRAFEKMCNLQFVDTGRNEFRCLSKGNISDSSEPSESDDGVEVSKISTPEKRTYDIIVPLMRNLVESFNRRSSVSASESTSVESATYKLIESWDHKHTSALKGDATCKMESWDEELISAPTENNLKSPEESESLDECDVFSDASDNIPEALLPPLPPIHPRVYVSTGYENSHLKFVPSDSHVKDVPHGRRSSFDDPVDGQFDDA